MTDDHDELLTSLARLAPAADPPPEPGSSRYDSILERAMTATDTTSTTDAPEEADGPPGIGPVRRPRHRLPRRAIAAAVAVAAALVVGVVVLQPGSTPLAPTPAAALGDAADATATVTSYRATASLVDHSTDPDSPPPVTYEIEADGDATRLTFHEEETGASGVLTVIGLDQWVTRDGETTHEVLAEEDTNLPYASSSAAVVEAALESATVEDLGREQVQGVEATHYRITLDQAGKEALAALSPRVVAQFELEYPSVGDRLDIWVADDLIRRLRVDTEIRRTDIELRDFGADIDIQPPA